MWGDGRVRKNSQVLAGATSPVHAEARRGSQTEAAEQELCVERRKGKWNHWSEAQSRVAGRYTLSASVRLQERFRAVGNRWGLTQRTRSVCYRTRMGM